MNKSIFVVLVGVIAAAMISSTVVTSDVSASTCPNCGVDSDSEAKDRANNNLDRHIEKGGEHGEEAQKIKDRINDDRPCPNCPV